MENCHLLQKRERVITYLIYYSQSRTLWLISWNKKKLKLKCQRQTSTVLWVQTTLPCFKELWSNKDWSNTNILLPYRGGESKENDLRLQPCSWLVWIFNVSWNLISTGLTDTSKVQATSSLNRKWVHPNIGFKAKFLPVCLTASRVSFLLRD